MNLYKIKYWVLFITGLLFVVSCKEDLGFREIAGASGDAPAVIKNPQVENLPGKAKISYELPSDPNLLYIKAVYKLASGQTAETKASYYTNSLTVEGFADTNQHTVDLYSVSRSEVVSGPITVIIKPLEAPIWDVFKSISIENAFGGYNLTALNPSKAAVSLLVMKKNEFNEWAIDNDKSVYSSLDSIQSKIRRLDTLPKNYAIYVQDRWGNKTDTMYKTVNPIFEEELLPSRFSTFPLPGDAPQVTNGAALQYMWDGKTGWPYTSFTDQTKLNGPHMVTFNTGILAKLSRIWIRPYPEGNRYYFLSTMKRFEIYGSANPSVNGNLDNSWVLLGSYTVKKPSGTPYGSDTAEDQAIAAAGFDWEVNLNAPRVKYIRIRCLENFIGGTNQSINEIKVYGDTRQ